MEGFVDFKKEMSPRVNFSFADQIPGKSNASMMRSNDEEDG